MNRYAKLLLFLLFPLLLLVIQLIPVDRTVPESDPEKDFIVVTNPPRRVTAMFRVSCYDCHSYRTRYPWYSGIAPVSWMIRSHVREGRERLNFSDFGNYSRENKVALMNEMKRVIEEETMPLKGYSLMHKEARLNDTRRTALGRWLTSGKNAFLIP